MKNEVIIRKQKFSIKTSSEQLAMQLRKQVNDDLQYSLLSVYDEVFSSLDLKPGSNIFIDKIFLSLGPITNEALADQLPQLVKHALLKQLQHQPAVKEMVQQQLNHTAENRAAHSSAHDDVAALMYFLENGIYPWWFSSSSLKKPSEIISALSNTEVENLLIKIISKQKAGDAKHTERIIHRFLQHLSPAGYKIIITALIALQSNRQLKVNLELLENDETVLLLSAFFSKPVEAYRKELIVFMLQQLYREDINILKVFIAQLFKKFGKSNSGSLNINTNTASKSPGKLNKEITEAIDALLKYEATDHRTNENSNNKDEQPLKKESFPETIEAATEGIYIENSGLVLLHPFLLPLFEAFGLLLPDHTFISEETKHKAAVILYYLQSSSTAYEEHQMAFNKILCGINIEELLPGDLVLTIEEKNECDELLRTVISYWQALKGAGIEAVQETFIQRKGKLSFKEDHWLLQVERSATDILIDRLPWGFSTIKLPWLKHIIYTEW